MRDPKQIALSSIGTTRVRRRHSGGATHKFAHRSYADQVPPVRLRRPVVVQGKRRDRPSVPFFEEAFL